MDHRRLRSRHWNLVLALGWAVALGGLACGGSQTRSNGSGGAGGGSGGSSGTGGSGPGGSATGGSSSGAGGSSSGSSSSSDGSSSGGSSSGGSASGGAGGSGGTTGSHGGAGGGGASGGTSGGAGGNATGGTGGSTVATPCSANGDCSGDQPLCETTLKLCVQCLQTGDCKSGSHCLGNQCVSYTSCANGDSRNCGSADLVCDPNRGLCFQCVAKTDCADNGQDCVNNACVDVPSCQSSSDCKSKLCDTDNNLCVECLADGDCTADQHCVQNTCQAACTTDKQCTPQGMLCDLTTSICVLCKAQTDCPESAYCQDGLCKPDVCDSTESRCSDDGVSACNANGDGWGPVTACDDAHPCKAFGGVATCGGSGLPDAALDGGNSSVDGGFIDAGNSSDTPIGPGCTTATMVPCTAIPQFTGTQTVDGNGDDMCQVPSFVFNKANAAKVNNYNNIPDSQFESITARVAWSPEGLRAFFDVTDASVQTVNMVDPSQAITKSYQGDSIELYLTSSNTLTGPTSEDSNSIQVIIPANGPAVSVKTDSNGTGTPTALPAEQYKQATTSGGYAIEVLLPWPGGPPSGGAQVSFDLAFNSADTIFGSVDDMRDAQVIYYMGTVGAGSSCQAPYCDDRAWCATTLQP